MRIGMFTGIMFFSMLCMSVTIFAEGKQYVEITSPFANVYKELDPRSEIIEQAKKGDHLELVYSGTSWYRVTVKGKDGWVEKRAGNVVDNPGGVSFLAIFLLLLLVAGTAGGVYYYIQKSKLAGA